LGVRVLWDDNDGQSPLLTEKSWSSVNGSEQPPANGSGRAYLMARLQQEHQVQAWSDRAETLAAELHNTLAPLSAQNTSQVLITPRLLLTAAYLVDRERVAAFRREVKALIVAYPALHFLCTGPWPPYNFVTAGVPIGRRKREEECPYYLAMNN